MINVQQVILGYRNTPVAQCAALELEKAGHCLITGPSGSGKTTLLYALAGLSQVLSGRIYIAGTLLSALSEAQCDRFRAQKIGMIFQNFHLVKALSVLDNLLLSSYAAGLPQDRSRAQSLLARLGLAGKQKALPAQLSQGQAQRVAIARALLHKPQLLLADEPTSNLDDASCASVIQLIKEMAAEVGATLVIATHDSRVKAHFSNIVQLVNP